GPAPISRRRRRQSLLPKRSAILSPRLDRNRHRRLRRTWRRNAIHPLHIAREIYARLKSIKMLCYMKTSGASAFHIFIPLEPKYTYEQTRTFAEVVGRLVASNNSKLTTFERTVSKRPKGRI